ncbi:hypothetical protein SAMN05421676_104325 [Salinibacillus kushneri]|uniref:Coupling factor for flagellin transcription and translation n=1 Tax=Salinibacillus kushneri TaxID=237682 RepID=A0A1I0E7F9_9BACI|nr:hypothetical protein [Salinibacillus kushneri]SET40921.1 hypothetical protein SAMN05421676_104325 [Salinibacillus kushneri]
MIEFLVIFSLMLHAIIFMFIIFLYRRFSQNSNASINLQEKEEIEAMLSSYINEMKEENERLLNIINENGKNVKEKPVQSTSTAQPLVFQDQDNHSSQEEEAISQTVKEAKETDEKSKEYQPETIMVADEVDGLSDHSKALQLYQEGLSIEEIAKKLNKGKTEIELFIKFQSHS